MFEIGDTLREARNRLGISLAEAEDATKIRSKYLQAMEHDDFSVIPGPTFVKGFMRTYAAFLGLDASALVEEYRARYEPEQEPQTLHRPSSAQVRKRSARPGTVLAALLAIAVILILAWIGWGNRGEEPADIGSGSLVVPTTVATSPVESTATTTAGAAAGTSEPGAQDVEFLVQAVNDRCWVVVKDGSAEGTVLYSGTLEEGAHVTYTVAEAAWLSIGNPGAVRLVLNGTTIDVPDPYGNFLLTAAGLERAP